MRPLILKGLGTANQVAYFIAGLVVILIVSQAAPKLAGWFVLALVVFLGLEALKDSHANQ